MQFYSTLNTYSLWPGGERLGIEVHCGRFLLNMALLDPHIFWARLTKMRDSLTSERVWNSAGVIAVPMDPASVDAQTFNKASAVFIHLFGLELPGSLVVLHGGTLHVMTSDKKCNMLEALQQGRPDGAKLVLHRLSQPRNSPEHFVHAGPARMIMIIPILSSSSLIR